MMIMFWGIINILKFLLCIVVCWNLLMEFNEVDFFVCLMYREDLNIFCVEIELVIIEGIVYVSNLIGWG